jgi:hypothetical protein
MSLLACARGPDSWTRVATEYGAQETSSEAQALQRQAIIRDGVYLYVPALHDFTLELLGQFELRDLRPADD